MTTQIVKTLTIKTIKTVKHDLWESMVSFIFLTVQLNSFFTNITESPDHGFSLFQKANKVRANLTLSGMMFHRLSNMTANALLLYLDR